MNQLMTSNQPLTMNSAELAELIKMERKEVNRKIREMFNQEIEGGIISLSLRPNGQVDYYMLPEVESTMFVGKWHTPFLRLLSEYWVSRKNTQPQVPQTKREWIEFALDQEKQLELAAPKVAFVDNLVQRDTLMTATQVAQKHKMSAVKLNRFLDELECVYSKAVKRGRVFKQKFVDNGYGEMKQTDLGHSQALFTPAGEVWINQQLVSEGMI